MAGTLGSGALSYLASRRSTEVQLRGIASEMEKLQALHAEEGRRERQEAYYGFITTVDAITQYVFGIRGPVTDDGYIDLVKKFDDDYTRVLFVGSSAVTKAADQMLRVFSAFTSAAAEEDEVKSPKATLRKAFDANAEDWGKARRQLLQTMKTDVVQRKVSAL